MAGRGSQQRASLRYVTSRVVAGAVLVGSVAFATATPAGASPPSAPTITRVTAGPNPGGMSLRWSPPRDPGGATITAFEYRVQIDDGPFSLAAPLAAGNVKLATAPCLAPAAAGHGCTYEIRATNGTPGTWSTPVGTNWLAPTVPNLGRSLGGPDAASATLEWRVPKSSGGLDLEYQYKVDGGSGWSAPTTIDPGSIVVIPSTRFSILAAELPCIVSGTARGCSYILTAVNGVGTSPESRTRAAFLRKPGPPTALQVFTSSVALGTGAASQAISWAAPTDVGGSALTNYTVSACTTSAGSICTNTSPGWAQFDNLTGSPPATSTDHDCPANGRCAYEVWAFNSIGKGWVFGFAGTGGPTNLTGVASSTVTGQINLQWLNPITTGATFGHYIVFECSSTLACSNGAWTNVPADAAPWTRVDLSGTGTTATFACGVVNPCTFRVGYIDGDGNIGGVSNGVTVVGH